MSSSTQYASSALLLALLVFTTTARATKLLIPKGSYADSGTPGRAMRYGPQQSGYTVEACVAACPSYPFIALQNGQHGEDGGGGGTTTATGECFCETEWSRVVYYGSNACGGEQNSVCSCPTVGSPWCNFVYEVVEEDPAGSASSEGSGGSEATDSGSRSDANSSTRGDNTTTTPALFAQPDEWLSTLVGTPSEARVRNPSSNSSSDLGEFFFTPRGAYADRWSRAMTRGPGQDYGYNKTSCRLACPGYRYIALQDGGQCFCSDDWADIIQYGTSSCGGDQNENCDCAGTNGSAWCNAVYEVGNTAATSFAATLSGRGAQQWQYTYLPRGSFPDRQTRALNSGPKAFWYTVEECLSKCTDYRYFALQGGVQSEGWCACTNSWARVTYYVEDEAHVSSHNCGYSYSEVCDCPWVGAPWCNYVYENLNFQEDGNEAGGGNGGNDDDDSGGGTDTNGNIIDKGNSDTGMWIIVVSCLALVILLLLVCILHLFRTRRTSGRGITSPPTTHSQRDILPISPRTTVLTVPQPREDPWQLREEQGRWEGDVGPYGGNDAVPVEGIVVAMQSRPGRQRTPPPLGYGRGSEEYAK